MTSSSPFLRVSAHLERTLPNSMLVGASGSSVAETATFSHRLGIGGQGEFIAARIESYSSI